MMTVIGMIAAFVCGVVVTLLLRKIPAPPKTTVMVDPAEFIERLKAERPPAASVVAIADQEHGTAYRFRVTFLSRSNVTRWFYETEFARKTDTPSARRVTRVMTKLVEAARWCQYCDTECSDLPHGQILAPATAVENIESAMPRLVDTA